MIKCGYFPHSGYVVGRLLRTFCKLKFLDYQTITVSKNLDNWFVTYE